MNHSNTADNMSGSIMADVAVAGQTPKAYSTRLEEFSLKTIKFIGSCLLNCLVSSKW
jgi:hypothetical protein